MPLRARPYRAFFSFSVLLFFVATAGCDVVARTTVGSERIGQALAQHFYYAFTQPLGSAMLLLPFLLLGWMSASLAKRKGFTQGLTVFLIGAFLLGITYFSAYQDSQEYLNQKMWTAAALSLGLLPVKSALPLLVCFGVWIALACRKNKAKA